MQEKKVDGEWNSCIPFLLALSDPNLRRKSCGKLEVIVCTMTTRDATAIVILQIFSHEIEPLNLWQLQHISDEFKDFSADFLGAQISDEMSPTTAKSSQGTSLRIHSAKGIAGGSSR